MANLSTLIKEAIREDYERVANERANDPQAKARQEATRVALQKKFEEMRTGTATLGTNK